MQVADTGMHLQACPDLSNYKKKLYTRTLHYEVMEVKSPIQ